MLEINGGSRPTQAVSTAVVGLVCTANDADVTLFPLNTPVYVNNVVSAAGKAGDKGTLARTLEAIGAQTKPDTIIVRVQEGATPAETASNVIGGSNAAGQFTGLKALLAAESRLGIKPRILGAPGLDTQAVASEMAVIAQVPGREQQCPSFPRDRMSKRPLPLMPALAVAGGMLCLCWSITAHGTEHRITCPPLLEPGSVQGKAPTGGRFAMPQEAYLNVAGMLHGPPEESGYLVPAESKNTRQGKASNWMQRWRFDQPLGYPTFVYRGYGGGSGPLQVFYPIPEAATECTATTSKKANVLQSAVFVCR